jgi:hypothetical protein
MCNIDAGTQEREGQADGSYLRSVYSQRGFAVRGACALYIGEAMSLAR